jgi:hypothetical protein
MRLAVKIGVGVGDLTLLHLGGVLGRVEYVAIGEGLTQAYSAEHHANPGDVILSKEVWALISESRREIEGFAGIPTGKNIRAENAAAVVPTKSATSNGGDSVTNSRRGSSNRGSEKKKNRKSKKSNAATTSKSFFSSSNKTTTLHSDGTIGSETKDENGGISALSGSSRGLSASAAAAGGGAVEGGVVEEGHAAFGAVQAGDECEGICEVADVMEDGFIRVSERWENWWRWC